MVVDIVLCIVQIIIPSIAGGSGEFGRGGTSAM